MKAKILLVEDEAPIRDMVSFTLKRAEMTVIVAEDVNNAIQIMGETLPDLVLLDWMMPGTSGLEFAKRLKRQAETRDIPIIMLTARSEEDDRVLGLDSGIDDYIVKPFSTRELVSRIKAVLRRSHGVDEQMRLAHGGLVIETASQRVHFNDASITLGPTEYRLLHFFMSNPERVHSRAKVLDHVWGTGVYVEERTVDVHIRRLRKALEPSGCQDFVQTVRGSGYRFSLVPS
jgi:two-component system, OmpR family, phosphate regulon response regulator PhoB